jgi:hypothetical protein
MMLKKKNKPTDDEPCGMGSKTYRSIARYVLGIPKVCLTFLKRMVIDVSKKIIVVFVNQDYEIVQRDVYHDFDKEVIERWAKETRRDLLNTGKYEVVGFFLEEGKE